MNSMPSVKKRLTALHSYRAAALSTDASSKNRFYKRHFMLGAGSVLDLSGSDLRIPELESLGDDAAKIRNDFSKISGDFRDVLGQVHRLG